MNVSRDSASIAFINLMAKTQGDAEGKFNLENAPPAMRHMGLALFMVEIDLTAMKYKMSRPDVDRMLEKFLETAQVAAPSLFEDQGDALTDIYEMLLKDILATAIPQPKV